MRRRTVAGRQRASIRCYPAVTHHPTTRCKMQDGFQSILRPHDILGSQAVAQGALRSQASLLSLSRGAPHRQQPRAWRACALCTAFTPGVPVATPTPKSAVLSRAPCHRALPKPRATDDGNSLTTARFSGTVELTPPGKKSAPWGPIPPIRITTFFCFLWHVGGQHPARMLYKTPKARSGKHRGAGTERAGDGGGLHVPTESGRGAAS